MRASGQTTSNFLVYNLQLPHKHDHWDFQAYGEIFGNYLPSEIILKLDQRKEPNRVIEAMSNLLVYKIQLLVR